MDKIELERKAAVLIRNARATLILTQKFYAVLVANVTPKASWNFPTMATDSVTHFYNPKFICELTEPEILGTQRHESEHDARHHSTRRGNRDPKDWNRACDYAINIDLIDEGVVLPKGALVREDFRGMSAEEIYRVLREEKRQQQQQPQPEQDKPESGDDGESEHEPESQDRDEEDAEDGDEGQGKPTSDDEEQGDESDGDGGEADSDGEGQHDGDAESAEASDGDDTADGGKGEGEADGDGEGGDEPQSCGEEGGCGEVLDAPGDTAEQADIDAKWEVITREAASLAKKAGQLPGHWAEIIEKRKTPVQDWRAVLREYIDAGVRRIETWNRRNRRFAHSGIVLPGSQRDGLNKVAFIIDASGSMHGQHVKVANELQAALDDGAISEAVIIYCDTEVYHVDRFVDGDQIELAEIRLGGTDMKPAFELIERDDPDASLIICLTDLFIGDPGPEPASPVLWCAYGNPVWIKKLGDELPWGKVLDVDTDVEE